MFNTIFYVVMPVLWASIGNVWLITGIERGEVIPIIVGIMGILLSLGNTYTAILYGRGDIEE